jgi:tRNA modification GTPase
MPITLDPNDTIAAVSSPPGPSARGIVRLSGPRAWRVALDGFRPDSDRPAPRYPEIRPGEMRIDGLRPLLPVMLALWPPPRTYTGQPLAEIHLVGSPPLLRQVLGHCLGRGARLAEPGEFTLRAFLSGRIDLTRAEAVLGVIEAANPAQLDAALHQLAGGLAGPILVLRDHLLDLVAHLEANLDFTEEPDVDPIVQTAMAGDLEAAAAQLAALARQLDERDRPEGHPRVVLVGPPNAGKSRLFNAMAGKDHAIVSPQAGTTRDYLTDLCDCGGLTIELVDTAGIEEGGDEVGRLAQRQRQRQFELADLLLECWPAPWGDRPAVDRDNRPAIRVQTRCDEVGSGRLHLDPEDELPTSAATGAGVEALKAAIERVLQTRPAEGNLPAGTAARCRGSLIQAEAALRAATDSLVSAAGDELVAFDLRLAAEELGKVVGAVVTDDILDRIFRRFCIGK